ncbi:uroporphyrinogen-III synthase [filamentous cyanobacterium LEGE 11480]|uniref:Uroporphyrinogen-III synthase n=1 Tax=Romeriopsis navalis LEGE 11480 TaxID=2777977 RepID=A0A928VTE6_9CYAN|nr:uroporphyrinogen-III synthase [Romeriopsis navalis]MBE9032711.1 uroporphyrinogen-III synthase [Romeriopsis navalis LEGE 11480]
MGNSLLGKTILITRSAGQSSEFTKLLTGHGANVVEMPALEIQPPSSWADLDAAIAQLDSFDWLFLTSANAVNFFFNRLTALGQDPAIVRQIKIAVVGQKTAHFLTQRDFTADYIPPDFVADSLLTHFPEAPQGKRILFPRVESGGREILVQAFTAKGADMTAVAAYQSGCPSTIDSTALEALTMAKVNVVTFASSKTVKHFCQLLKQALGNQWQSILDSVIIASIGPQTTITCREKFGRVDLEAAEYTLPGLTQSIVDFYHSSNNHTQS